VERFRENALLVKLRPVLQIQYYRYWHQEESKCYLRVVAALQFLLHEPSKVGHGISSQDPLYDPTAAKRLSCVLGMLSSLEVKVLCPT
jgi:hypothetical protein